jgi:hypothetical protein
MRLDYSATENPRPQPGAEATFCHNEERVQPNEGRSS